MKFTILKEERDISTRVYLRLDIDSDISEVDISTCKKYIKELKAARKDPSVNNTVLVNIAELHVTGNLAELDVTAFLAASSSSDLIVYVNNAVIQKVTASEDMFSLRLMHASNSTFHQVGYVDVMEHSCIFSPNAFQEYSLLAGSTNFDLIKFVLWGATSETEYFSDVEDEFTLTTEIDGLTYYKVPPYDLDKARERIFRTKLELIQAGKLRWNTRIRN